MRSVNPASKSDQGGNGCPRETDKKILAPFSTSVLQTGAYRQWNDNLKPNRRWLNPVKNIESIAGDSKTDRTLILLNNIPRNSREETRRKTGHTELNLIIRNEEKKEAKHLLSSAGSFWASLWRFSGDITARRMNRKKDAEQSLEKKPPPIPAISLFPVHFTGLPSSVYINETSRRNTEGKTFPPFLLSDFGAAKTERGIQISIYSTCPLFYILCSHKPTPSLAATVNIFSYGAGSSDRRSNLFWERVWIRWIKANGRFQERARKTGWAFILHINRHVPNKD